jgi:hypothetical protein
MRFRPSLSVLARTGVVALVALACSGITSASAQTGAPVAIPVDPPEVQFAMVADQVAGRAQVQSPLVVPQGGQPEEENYRGTVGLWLPDGVDDGSVVVHLDLAPTAGAARPGRTRPTRPRPRTS